MEIKLLLYFTEQFLSARDDPTSRKENPVVEQEELRDKECSSKRKREKPEAKGTEEREKDESKRLKKGKKTTVGKNICRSDGNFDSPSQLKQRAANGLLAASIEEEPETVTVNFRGTFFLHFRLLSLLLLVVLFYCFIVGVWTA